MANYGIRVSRGNVSALTASGSDLLMSTRFPFAKIDPTQLDSFRTTTINFLSDAPDNVKTLLTSFNHGYDYEPQVWGLWNVTWSASLTGLTQNGYGTLINTSGAFPTTLSYEVDATKIYLYVEKGYDGITPRNTIGTTATLTTYIFVDDLSNQSYN